MTGILKFETKHGTVAIEVDEDQAGTVQASDADDGYVRKGSEPMTAKGPKIPSSFSKAMEPLRAYAGNIEEVISDLDITPREVSVEVGLKWSGETGFIIAKAGTEVEMKVALTWEPKGRR